MPLPQYGSPEGISDRLLDWADRLGRDKHFPWVGSGLIADLKTAAAEFQAAQAAENLKTTEFDL